MATIQRYVNTASTAGGDGTTNATSGANRAYASLFEWEAAMGSVGTATDNYIVDCCGTAADTTAVNVNFSITTGGSVTIRGNRSDAAGFYAGSQVLSANHYRLVVTGGTPLTLTSNNATVDGIQVHTVSPGIYFGIQDSSVNSTVRNCRAFTGATNSAVGIGSNGISPGGGSYNWLYENNLVVGFADGLMHRSPDFWAATVTIRHNTVYGSGGGYGIRMQDVSGSSDCQYNIYANAIANTGTNVGINPAVISASGQVPSYADNACSVASGTTDEIVLGTAANAWISPGVTTSSDFAIKSTGPLFNAVNPTHVTLDITGATRDGTNHDVGAFEFIAVAPAVVTDPTNQTVSEGATATFSAVFSGTPTPTVQWQRSTNSGGSWSDVAGAVASSYTTPATTITGGSANNGDQFRCQGTNSAGGPISTAAATLTVNVATDTTPPVITGPSGATGATSSINVAENTTAVHTFTANESVTWALSGGADVAKFAIGSGTGVLTFVTAPNYDVAGDADGNNSYVVGVQATDTAANATVQTLTVTVTNVNEAPAFIGPSISIPSGTAGTAIAAQNFALLFSDPDTGDLGTYTKGGTWPTGPTLSSAGMLGGVYQAAGTNSALTVIRTDANGLTATSNSFSITSNAAVATGSVTTSKHSNSAGLGGVLGSTLLHWTWFAGGRIGAMSGSSMVEGTGTTNALGVLTVTGLPLGVGVLMTCARAADASTDAVFYEALTAV